MQKMDKIVRENLPVTGIPGISFVPPKQTEVNGNILSNPRIVPDNSMRAGQKVTWDCIWFGNYPQAEVISSNSKYTALPESFLQTSDLIRDDGLYQMLQLATEWDGHGDIVTGGNKYRRIKKEDATYTSTYFTYYQWKSETEYHYFKYQPIKWRVLSVNGTEVFLLADNVLDNRQYHTKYEPVTWEGSIIRSWLDGYGASYNIQNNDFSRKNFINTAFGIPGQQVIKETFVENKNNLNYGTDGGNNTKDKIFLLSESEIYTDAAKLYGFVSGYDKEDKACGATSSVYAKAMGTCVCADVQDVNIENCWWWLRTPGKYNTNAVKVCPDGGISYDVHMCHYGVRPALNLDFTRMQDAAFSHLWDYAGTVCSDGTYEEFVRYIR